MTFEELKEQERRYNRRVYAAHLRLAEAEKQYIEEHQPLPLKRYQRISVRLRVTEEHRKWLIDKYRNMKKYQLGNEYVVRGFFVGYNIGDKGDIRPCLYGMNSYSRYDEIVSVTLTKEQPQGDCRKCIRYKDGGCYMTGGESPSHKVKDGDVVCPQYREVRQD